jgi:uncharacterized protein YndB with AHSA1/START domain
MPTVEYAVVIRQPVRDVWHFVTNLENTPKWDIGVRETRVISSGPRGLGTTFQNIGPFLGRESVREFQVTEFEPNERVTVELLTPSSLIRRAEITYTFEPTAEGTKLTFTGSAEFNGVFRLLGPILIRRARKDGQGDLENLKRLLEGSGDRT